MKNITIDGTCGGRVFEGIAGVFSNGMTKLLMDYPEAEREDILRFLFEDHFGASLHHVKVEIGSDVNTSSGTVPSHMRDGDDFDIQRGAELWLASRAKAINPEITTEALRWGTPAWIQNDDDKYRYYLNFLRGAKENFGITFDYLGCDQNEGSFDRDWVVRVLKPGLVRDGFGDVKLVAADGDAGWQIADDVLADEELNRAVAVLNCHYTVESTERAAETGKPLWAGEHLAAVRHDFRKGALHTAYLMLAMYPLGKMTMYEMHPALEANYPSTPFNYKGMIAASWPWSGHYEVTPGLWAAAHFTQFIKPGWQYLDGACFAGRAEDGEEDSGYVALKSPDGRDWSMIFVNTGGEKEYTCQICGRLDSGPLHVRLTTKEETFAEKEAMIPVNGVFQLRLPEASICSVSTAGGQKKGEAARPVPGEKGMALPWREDFSAYAAGRQPLYISDQGGAFEVAQKAGKKVLQQKITGKSRPTDWVYRTTPLPYTLIGSEFWTDYGVEAEVLLTEKTAFVYAAVRCVLNGKFDVFPSAYLLRLWGSGAWTIQRQEEVLAAGSKENFDLSAFHRLSLRAEGETLSAFLDGDFLTEIRDPHLSAGQAALGSSYHENCFARLEITGGQNFECLRYGKNDRRLVWRGDWKSGDGDFSTYERRLSVTEEAGASLEFTFDGTSAAITGNRDRNGGTAQLWVDGSLKKTVDSFCMTETDRKTHVSIPKARNVVAAVYGLEPGIHRARLVAAGEKNPQSEGRRTAVDSVEICGGSGLI